MSSLPALSDDGKLTLDLPFGKHPRGYWIKRVKGTLRYFGRIDSDPTGERALGIWHREKDALLEGRTPPPRNGDQQQQDAPTPDEFSVKNCCDYFLTHKEKKLDAGRIGRRHFADLQTICKLLADTLGRSTVVASLTPDDFARLNTALEKRYRVVALKNAILRIRGVFKFAFVNDKIEKPAKFGSMFDPPSDNEIEKARNAKPPRVFDPTQLREVIDAASQPMKAMILLGINAGYGNSDCSELRFRHLDLDGGWVNFPRPKTGAKRRCKLWKETIKAIKEAIKQRPTPKREEDADRVFLTRCGQAWVKLNRNGTPADALGQEFSALLVEKKLHRPGFGFYSLRHQFETSGGGCKDQVAVDHIMGHVDGSTAGRYREAIDDSRLEAVAAHVHDWLYPPVKVAKKSKRKTRKPKQAAAGRPKLRIVG